MTQKALVVKLSSAEKKVHNYSTSEGMEYGKEYTVPRAPFYLRAVAAGDLIKVKEIEIDEPPAHQVALAQQLRKLEAENARFVADMQRIEVDNRRLREDLEGARRDAADLRGTVEQYRSEIDQLRSAAPAEPEEIEEVEEEPEEDDGPDLT